MWEKRKATKRKRTSIWENARGIEKIFHLCGGQPDLEKLKRENFIYVFLFGKKESKRIEGDRKKLAPFIFIEE